MSGTSMDPGDKSSAEIEREVEQTRNNVSDTLDTLRAKLQPSQMVDQVVEQITDYARSSGGTEFMRNLGTTVKDNPMPVVLIGAGIAWLLMSRNDGPSYAGSSYQSSRGYQPVRSSAGPLRRGIHDAMSATREMASSAADAMSDVVVRASSMAGDVAERVKDTASDLASRASDMGNEAVQSVSSMGRSATSSFSGHSDSVRRFDGGSRGLADLAETQPLVYGALGLAIGATLGALLPSTEAEDRLMGEARDQMATQAAQFAQDGLETVRNVAGEHIERVKDTLAETYEDTKQQLDRGGISGVGQALGNAASNVARAAEDTLRDAAQDVKRGISEGGTTRI